MVLLDVFDVFVHLFDAMLALFATEAMYMKKPTKPPPQTRARSAKIPMTHIHAFDDLGFGCIVYAGGFGLFHPACVGATPGRSFVGRGWSITTVGAASFEAKVKTEPSSRQKFRPSSS